MYLDYLDKISTYKWDYREEHTDILENIFEELEELMNI